MTGSMFTLMNQLTIEETIEEFQLLVDKIAVMYLQLNSNEFGAVGTSLA